MKTVKIEVSQKPGKFSIDNLSEAEEFIKNAVSAYSDPENTYQKNISRAKHDRKKLLSLRASVEKAVSEPLKTYTAPVEQMKFELLKLTSLIDAPIAAIDSYISSHEKNEREKSVSEIKAVFDEFSAPLGDFADSVFNSPAFLEEKWLKSPHVHEGTRNAVISKITEACADIGVILSAANTLAPVLLAKYFEDLSLDSVEEFKKSIVKAANGTFPGAGNAGVCPTVKTIASEVHASDSDCGGASLTLNCTREDFERSLLWFKLSDIDFSVSSCSFAACLKERKKPDFDSFVALDIETTGSYGAASGDAPAEITEIGAVKVENGVITDKFSMLANPGRSITAPVVKLTHITDEMVKGKPPVKEVVKRFIEFAGDSIIVGHGVGTNDLPYICRAAQSCGVKFTNEYFDTCKLADSMKEKYGWQKIKLEYLASLFGINQNSAHRAWCDAEANAQIYFALKALCTGDF